MTRSFLQVDGLRISFLERPEAAADRPALVLLHGLIAEAVTFQKLIDQLLADRRIVAMDLPGAGFSDRPTTHDVSFRGMSRLVREALAMLGLERPVLLGHSHGGALALRLAADAPEAFSGLILMSPAHPFSQHEDALVQFYLNLPGRGFAHLLPRLPDWVHHFAFRRMPGDRRAITPDDIAPYLHTLRYPGTVAHMLRLLKSWERDMLLLRRDLRRCPVATPALVVWGEADVIVPAATAPALLGHLSDACFAALPGIGHLPNEEAPAACAAAIRGWLDRPNAVK